MTTRDEILQLRSAGADAINNDGNHDFPTFPQAYEGTIFRQMFEYAVEDFEAEVGFYCRVFGFPTIALTADYALFTHPEAGYCISFRRDTTLPLPSTVGLKLLFMTTDIPAAESHLARTGLATDRKVGQGSPVQQVIYFSTPAGVAVEIWEDPSPQD